MPNHSTEETTVDRKQPQSVVKRGQTFSTFYLFRADN